MQKQKVDKQKKKKKTKKNKNKGKKDKTKKEKEEILVFLCREEKREQAKREKTGGQKKTKNPTPPHDYNKKMRGKQENRQKAFLPPLPKKEWGEDLDE